MNKRAEGTRYEELAAAYLGQMGYRIITRNFRCKKSEIDLIAREGKYLVFVEVKERSSSSCGYGSESVNVKKQERICAAARYYLKKYRIDPLMPVRFDVASIDHGTFHVIRNAFLYRE